MTLTGAAAANPVEKSGFDISHFLVYTHRKAFLI